MLGVTDGIAAAALRAVACPLSVLYRAGVAGRNAAYAAGLFTSRPLPGPTVSVGNLSLGGTGKTPCVQWVARQLTALGRKPAIISRGYGASAGASAETNDEAAMTARAMPGMVQRCNPDRVAAARSAAEDTGADCFVLDDGFQHRRARRDVDVVLLDASVPPRGMHLFPRGQLREPVSALGRADVVVLSHTESCGENALRRLRESVARETDADIVEAAHRITALATGEGGEVDASALEGERVYAFCGIGNPEAFVALLKGAGAQVVGATFFRDHHAYVPGDLHASAARADALDAPWLVTTEKDAVKLGNHRYDDRLRVVRIDLYMTSGEALLRERIAAVVDADACNQERSVGHSTH